MYIHFPFLSLMRFELPVVVIKHVPRVTWIYLDGSLYNPTDGRALHLSLTTVEFL
ncbi:hypothetical protein, unlikely [Trypanosoma brucei brucei TREU927]|uniref:Uncharacterized protein n=1 Tax=Trypanosoma brucei brucei (strain 927/4 GUTat10.1) TaxID=185431 RepID=Q38FB4_TRYB2|nr:hypothetical protein, unlikely [Trypanosoma brucei brucei TREU927]EAN76506.1 hypothetical protein, unlikely [Trypanosoma brucei brucei TREU927]